MKYYLAKFFRYVPQISGMQVITGVDNFTIIKVTTDQALTELQAHPDNIPLVELTEIEATDACKFYGETRGYRKAYSDVEGLEPDADELVKGKRKTKVYITPAQEQAVISLMKKAFKLHIEEEMKDRKAGKPELTGKSRKQYDKNIHVALLEKLDTLNTIDDIVEAREQVLGIEMSKDLAVRKGLWDEQKNLRKGKMQYGVRF
jgi:hypothetical protein